MTDTVKPDTSEAAVERDAATVEHFARVWPEDAEESVRDAMRNSLVHISALLRALLAERDAAVIARDDAIRRMADASRDAGRWRGISEGNDVVIKHLRAERDALRAQLAGARTMLQIAQDGNAALRWAVTLGKIQRAAAAALEIAPDSEMFAALHRTAASSLASDDGPQNEAALREAGHE